MKHGLALTVVLLLGLSGALGACHKKEAGPLALPPSVDADADERSGQPATGSMQSLSTQTPQAH